jgi:hypothetical protein
LSEFRIYIRVAAELNCHPHLKFGRFGDGRRSAATNRFVLSQCFDCSNI